MRAGAGLFLYAYLPSVAVLAVLMLALGPGKMADFRVIWGAGRDVLTGHGGNFIYPPPVAISVIPYSLLPFSVAAVLWFFTLVASIAVTLRVLGVRDWRCYGVALAGAPALATLGSGAISSLLALGAALAWRYRDRGRALAPLLALVVVAKVFMWPLLFWLAATRRWRDLCLTLVSGAVLLFGTWAIIGFAGLAAYPDKLHSTAISQQRGGYSPLALGLALDFPVSLARATWVAFSLLLIAAIFVAARTRDGDRRAFVLAIFAALAATPISWLHYFVLLLVPVALASRVLSPIWFVPFGFWACSMGSDAKPSRILLAMFLSGAVAAAAFTGSHPELRRRLRPFLGGNRALRPSSVP